MEQGNMFRYAAVGNLPFQLVLQISGTSGNMIFMCMKKTNGCSGSYEHGVFKGNKQYFMNNMFGKKASVGLKDFGVRAEQFGSL